MTLATERHIDMLRAELERRGFRNVEIDTSYGLVTGIAFEAGGERAAVEAYEA